MLRNPEQGLAKIAFEKNTDFSLKYSHQVPLTGLIKSINSL